MIAVYVLYIFYPVSHTLLLFWSSQDAKNAYKAYMERSEKKKSASSSPKRSASSDNSEKKKKKKKTKKVLDDVAYDAGMDAGGDEGIGVAGL